MKRFSLLSACAFIILLLMAANHAEAGHYISINGMGGFAQKEFKDNVDNGGGLSGGYAYGFGGDSPVNILLGSDVGYFEYGRETFSTPFSSTVKRVKVDVETTNNIVLLDFTAKLLLNCGFINPYTEGHVGWSYLYTSSSVKDYQGEMNTIASSKNFSDWTTNTAFGGGFIIPVYHSKGNVFREGDKKSFTINLDFKFLYWWGSDAEYLKKGGVSEDPDTGDLVYDVKKSRTDMTSTHLGVVITF